LDIYFNDRRIEKLCTDYREAVRTLGQNGAKKLRQRLDDLARAATLEQMRILPGGCEELKGDRAGQFSVRLAGGDRLIFEPDHDPVPIKADGGMDWQQITAILLLEIDDYH
jgi:proteic killer suppression protein